MAACLRISARMARNWRPAVSARKRFLWETETGKQLQQMKGRTNMAYAVAFSADGTQLTSGRTHALGFAHRAGPSSSFATLGQVLWHAQSRWKTGRDVCAQHINNHDLRYDQWKDVCKR